VLDEKEKKLKEERKKEERERWWAGVEIFRPKSAPSDAPAKPSPSEEEADKTAMMLNRYKADYSHWNSWTPTDEASLAEQAEAERKEEEIRNREFEKNNAEFCDQFLTDMEKRKKVTEKKQESADISRLKGNRYFKAKSYEKALELYMEALRECPFDAKTVNNVAQVSSVVRCIVATALTQPVSVTAGVHKDEEL
jgi:tetratricopeptide (TPR) repeat protein